jgi:hypothetical protein
LPSAKVADLMGRVRRALDRARPLNDNHRGVAVFADADDVRTYDVPLRLPELAALGDRFAVAPLLPTISLQGRFFLLTLAQDRILLLEGTALTLEPVDLEGRELAAWTTMPPPRAPQVHAFLADRGGQGTRTVFHGSTARRTTARSGRCSTSAVPTERFGRCSARTGRRSSWRACDRCRRCTGPSARIRSCSRRASTATRS